MIARQKGVSGEELVKRVFNPAHAEFDPRVPSSPDPLGPSSPVLNPV